MTFEGGGVKKKVIPFFFLEQSPILPTPPELPLFGKGLKTYLTRPIFPPLHYKSWV